MTMPAGGLGNVITHTRPFHCRGCIFGTPIQIIFVIRFCMKLPMRSLGRIMVMTLFGGKKPARLVVARHGAIICLLPGPDG